MGVDIVFGTIGVIVQQNYKIGVLSMDRIRRRLKEGRKRAILSGVKTHHNPTQRFKQPPLINTTSLKNAMSVLPVVSSMHSYPLRTAHSQSQRDQQSIQTPFNYSLLEQMRHSLLITTQRPKGIIVKRKSTIQSLSVSPEQKGTLFQRKFMNTRGKSGNHSKESKSQCLFKPCNPHPTVIIIESQSNIHPVLPPKANKHSLISRKAFTVLSHPPLRKCSISAWEGPEEHFY